jgi:L-ascorbate metabolism protein UlaG (beta-lactamase superfamily)
MSISFTWLGHSAFTMQIDGHTVLFDPFLTGNPLASTKPDTLACDLMFLSHAHGDHTSDALSIAKRTGAKVVCNWEIGAWLQEQGVSNVHQGNTGGSFDHGFLHAKFTYAQHSSSFPDGRYGGNPNGFVITANASGQRLYYAGDTALFSDMKLIGDARLDVAFLPIGDNFTMGIDDSIRAVKWLHPRYVVPMHYNTFDVIVVPVTDWARRISNETNAQPIILDPGGSFTLP